MAPTATLVILLANLIMVVRVLAIAWALSPSAVSLLVPGSLLAVLIGAVVIGLDWRQLASQGELPVPQTRNPTACAPPSASAPSTPGCCCAPPGCRRSPDAAGCTCSPSPRASPTWTQSPCSPCASTTCRSTPGMATAISILLAMLANLGFKTFLTFLLGGAELARRVVVGMFAVARALPGESSGC